MHHALRRLAGLLAVLVLAAGAGQAAAQVVTYCPPPVVSYYAPPMVLSAPVTVSYYAPAVSYYAPHAVSYYTPVYAPMSVTTYQGILPWRRTTVMTYGAPAYFVPAPVVRYYTPGYVIR